MPIPPSAPLPFALRVATWNMHSAFNVNEDKAAAKFRELRSLQRRVDIIALQETRGDEGSIEAANNGLAITGGRAFWSNIGRQAGGVAIVVSQEALAGKFKDAHLEVHDIKTGRILAIDIITTLGERLSVVCVHLDPAAASGRAADLDMVRDHLLQEPRRGTPVYVMGDFNYAAFAADRVSLAGGVTPPSDFAIPLKNKKPLAMPGNFSNTSRCTSSVRTRPPTSRPPCSAPCAWTGSTPTSTRWIS